MTPEQAETVFYEVYAKGLWPEPEKRIVQEELRKRCWQAVIDAVRSDHAREMATDMLKHIEKDAA